MSRYHRVIALFLCILSAQPAQSQTVTKILGNNNVDVADVVPGSTAPSASKKALVVTISPNSPSPAGSQDVNLIKVGGSAVSLGQKTSANSMPMVVASDQSTLPVNMTQVGGAALAFGQTLMASSLPVAIASNQSALAISGAVVATPASVVDAGNSSSTPLAGSATFTGTTADVLQYAAVEVFAFSNVAGTLNLEFSTDGTNWDLAIPYTLTAGQALDVPSGPHARYFRVRYVNGGAAQASFRLQTLLLAVTPAPHTIPLGSVPLSGDDAVLTQSEIVGLSSSGGGTYVPVKVSPSGAVQVGGAVDIGQTNAAQVLNTTPTSGYGLVTRGVYPTQGSTTSGQTGPLSQGAVTTAAPTYTNAQTSPLSLTTAGALRVDASASTQPVSGTVTANQGGAPWSVSQATASSLNAQVVGTAAAGAAVSGNPVLVGGSDGTNAQRLRVDSSGRPYLAGDSFKASIANETVTLRTGPGVLTGVYVTSAGTTSGLAIYDNTTNSGTLIFSGSTTAAGLSYPMRAAFSTGLTYSTTGGAAANLTITYEPF